MLVSDISDGQNKQLNCMTNHFRCEVVFCQVLRSVWRCSVLWVLFCANPSTASVTEVFGSCQQCTSWHGLVLPHTKFTQGKALFGKDICASLGEDEVKTLSSPPEVACPGPQASGSPLTAVSWTPHSWLGPAAVSSVKDPCSFTQLPFTGAKHPVSFKCLFWKSMKNLKVECPSFPEMDSNGALHGANECIPVKKELLIFHY